MTNWIKNEKHGEYKNVLRGAFPKALRSEVDAVLSILPFDDNNVKCTEQQTIRLENLISPWSSTSRLDDEVLTIPDRVYFNEPDAEDERKLTGIQKIILNCIYLRHHDGYIRQRRLEGLLGKSDNWIIPFTIQLLGEYVVEILPVLDRHINDKTIEGYVKFTRENPNYWKQIKNRMISYWNEYYRRQYPKLNDYPGQELEDKISESY